MSETTNSMTFWGVGAYGGWKYENFAVMGDVSYTSTWNSVDQDVDHRMEMGDLEATSRRLPSVPVCASSTSSKPSTLTSSPMLAPAT